MSHGKGTLERMQITSQADEGKERGKEADQCEEEEDTATGHAVDTNANPFRKGQSLPRS